VRLLLLVAQPLWLPVVLPHLLLVALLRLLNKISFSKQ
jgi:hypothetical protein